MLTNNAKNSGRATSGGVVSALRAACWCTAVMFAVVAPARGQLTVGGAVNGNFEAFIEARLARRVEMQLEENVEEDVQDEIEDDIENIIQDSIDDSLEDTIAANVEAGIEAQAEESIEAAVEDAVAQSVEETVQESVEGSVEDAVAAAVESGIDASVEEDLESEIEQSIETSVEQQVADSVEEAVEDGLEAAVEESVGEAVEASVEAAVAAAVEQGVESGVEESIADAVEDRLEGHIETILDRIENELEVDERRINSEQWLVMAEPEVFAQLAMEGYLFDKVTDLPGMGLRLAEVAAPSSFDISKVRQGVVDVVGADRAEVDINHYYTAGSPGIVEAGAEIAPRSAIVFPSDLDNMELRVGMIDSRVDTTHPAFSGSHIETRSFASRGASLPTFHGTAIASILAANDPQFRGLAPRAELYAAAVFEQDDKRGEIASTVSLVRALDWLVSSGVDVVNLSLAGPPNRLLEAALERAAARDVLVLAAAGNGGPVAGPMYPAAYTSVIAVTAVDSAGRVYRLANRGDYLDLAAPGVGVVHALAGGGYTASSGTSFAVPFAATAAARLRKVNPGNNVLQSLRDGAEDLGAPGRDEIYGYGLLRPGA